MARKKKHEEHVNHEAWAIPYADLLTLLLAFFVVMYAISSVNEGKYRIMADALSSAFGGSSRTIAQLQVGNQQIQGSDHDNATAISSPLPAPSGSDPSRISSMNAGMRSPISVRDTEAIDKAAKQLQQISDRISRALSPLIDRGMITVRRTELWIEVEINSDILFATASATLSNEARQTLQTLAEVLQDTPNSLRIEGHTDNKPIATAQYPSNWELSAARAASVVHLFAGNGIAPERLSMVGYGEVRPRADNAEPEGRNRNRRVMIIILADSAAEMSPIGQQLLGNLPSTTADDTVPAAEDTAMAVPAPRTAVQRPSLPDAAPLRAGGQP